MIARPRTELPAIDVDDVLARLKRIVAGRGLSPRLVRACGLRQWDSPCPAHDDRHPSMRMYLLDGHLYFRCYAGCHYNLIRAALDLPAGRAGGARPGGVADLPPPPPEAVRYNFGHLASMFAGRGRVLAPDLAAALGVSAAALLDLGVGLADRYPMFVRARGAERPVTAWAFPMRDAADNVTGLRMRGFDGGKFSWTDSVPGLFLPRRWLGTGPVLIVEGPTDTAACWDWGFDAIGRPSCNSGDELIGGVIDRFRAAGHRRDYVILSNLDEPKWRPDGTEFRPGQDGAEALAGRIAWRCPSLRLVCPPGPKDARQWLAEGGTRADVEAVIGSKGQWRPERKGRRA
jgi:hypothetical protein